MDLFLVVLLLLVIFAVWGGVALSPLLFLVLVLVLVLFLIVGGSRRW